MLTNQSLSSSLAMKGGRIILRLCVNNKGQSRSDSETALRPRQPCYANSTHTHYQLGVNDTMNSGRLGSTMQCV